MSMAERKRWRDFSLGVLAVAVVVYYGLNRDNIKRSWNVLQGGEVSCTNNRVEASGLEGDRIPRAGLVFGAGYGINSQGEQGLAAMGELRYYAAVKALQMGLVDFLIVADGTNTSDQPDGQTLAYMQEAYRQIAEGEAELPLSQVIFKTQSFNTWSNIIEVRSELRDRGFEGELWGFTNGWHATRAELLACGEDMALKVIPVETFLTEHEPGTAQWIESVYDQTDVAALETREERAILETLVDPNARIYSLFKGLATGLLQILD